MMYDEVRSKLDYDVNQKMFNKSRNRLIPVISKLYMLYR